MDSNKLLKDLEKVVTRYYQRLANVNQTDEMRKYLNHVNNTTEVLRQVGESKNITDIVACEKAVLDYELKLYGKDNPYAVKDIKKATNEINRALKTFEFLQNNNLYKSIVVVFPISQIYRKSGIPKDAFHFFVKEHCKRLNKRLENVGLPTEKYTQIEVRCFNLQIALDEYMKLQAQALDITHPEDTDK